MAADSLGDRIKLNYEGRAKTQLLRRTPVIIRVDGKAFHTYTRGCTKPFDQDLIDCMAGAARSVAEQMQGFKMAFIQSDEASFLLTDYDDITTEAWFDYKVQKMASVAASLMTAYFNQEVQIKRSYAEAHQMECSLKSGIPACFDARCFNIPEAEISNYFLWRAQDWARNSIQMLARANFSQAQLHGKNREGMHEMLHSIGKNWTTDTTAQQRNGSWIAKDGQMYHHIQPVYSEINDFRISQLIRGTDTI